MPINKKTVFKTHFDLALVNFRQVANFRLRHYFVLLSAFLIVLSLGSCRLLLPKEIRELEKREIFSISKDKKKIILNGEINTSAFEKFILLAEQYPTVKKIEIINCLGSINDEVNLELARYIQDNKYDIHLLDNGSVASGGTDLFLAGRKRTMGNNTKVGVHSWAGLRKTATDFPKGHRNHLPYIKYYEAIGFNQKDAEDFYYFTINAAPADEMYYMTKQELKKYNFQTKK